MRSNCSAPARVFGVALAILAIVAVAQPAQARTGFDYSVPTDGAFVGEPTSEVTVAFTEPVSLIGSGFEVLDPQGNLLQPFAVTDDDTIFRLQFDPPLAGGAVGVRYNVAAQDGNTLSGSFSFTVSAPLPTSTTVAVTVPVSAPSAAAPTSTPAPVTAISSVAPTAAAQTTVVAGGSTSGPGSDPGDQSNSGLAIGIAAGVAAMAAVFLAYRARTAGSP